MQAVKLLAMYLSSPDNKVTRKYYVDAFLAVYIVGLPICNQSEPKPKTISDPVCRNTWISYSVVVQIMDIIELEYPN